MEILTDIGIYLAAGAAAFAIGVLLERRGRVRLERRAAQTETEWDDWLVKHVFHLGPGLLLALGAVAVTQALRPPPPSVEPVLTLVLKVIFVLVLVRLATDVTLTTIRVRNVRLGRGGVSVLRKAVRAIMAVVGLLIILDQFGISVGPILATLGVGGIAIALALQPTLGNIFAGIQLVSANQFKVGDYLGVPTLGVEGTVTDIGWRTTTLTTLLDNEIMVPNAVLADTVLSNLHAPERTLKVAVPVGVHYDTRLEEANRIALETIREIQRDTPGADPAWEGETRWRRFDDSAITFDAILRATSPVHRFEVTTAFIMALQRRFAEHDIEIPYPIRNLYLRTPVQVDPAPLAGPTPEPVASIPC